MMILLGILNGHGQIKILSWRITDDFLFVEIDLYLFILLQVTLISALDWRRSLPRLFLNLNLKLLVLNSNGIHSCLFR